jgi:hypothetical protein
MNLWPFRRRAKKPKWTINLHESVASDATVAAAWTVYGGVKAMVRTGEYFETAPDARGHDSPFDEECYARDAMAEFWAVQPDAKRATQPYLHLLMSVRDAGFVREYVWRFLRDPAWPRPAGLKEDAFAAWCTKHGFPDHKPPTLAFVTPG